MSLVSHTTRRGPQRNPPHQGDNDEFYYNAAIRADNLVNDNKDAVEAVYTDNRVVPILSKPDDYRMAVVRFSVPTTTIPIFFWKTASVPPEPVWPTWRRDQVALVYEPAIGAPTVYQEFLVYIPNGSDYAPGAPSGPIWTFGQYLDMLNTALAAAFAALDAAHGPLATTAPYWSYNAQTQLFTLHIPMNYQDGSLPAGAKISMYANYPIARLFGNQGGNNPKKLLPLNDPSPLQFRYDPEDLGDNVVAGVANMQQELNTLVRWNGLEAIVFDTPNVPIEPEFLPADDSSGATPVGQGANQLAFSFTDFEPIVGLPDRLPIQYYPQGPLRFYTLTSPFPMNNVTFTVSWVDRNGDKRPIVMVMGDTLTLKIAFRKKTLNLT
jgi:hypothetical protein